MKNTLLLFALAFIGMSTFAQDLDIEWGEPFDGKTEIQKILGYADGQLVTYSMKGKKRFIGTYDESTHAENSINLFTLPKIEGKQTGMLNLALTGDNVTCILYVYRKATKSFALYAYEIGLDAKQKGKPEKIYESESGSDRIKGMKVNIDFSPLNKKAIVYFNRTNKDRTEFYSDVVLLDLDKKLNMLSSNKYSFDMRESRSERVSFRVYHDVQEDGTFSIMHEKIEFEKKAISNFELTAIRYDSKGEKMGESILSEEGKVLLSPSLVQENDGLRIVGYYMINPKKRAIIAGYSGIFSAKLNSDMSVEEFTTAKFSDEFFKNLYSEKRIAKMKAKGTEIIVPAAYTMNEIFVHNDGTLTILSELFQITVTQTQGGKTTQTIYGPILYFKLNDNGEIIAADAIKKMQASSTQSIGGGLGTTGISIFVSVETKDKMKKYWSYASLTVDGSIYLVFNDHLKNESDGEDDLSKRMMNPKKSIPYLVTIDPEGNFTKEAMKGAGTEGIYSVPQITYQTSEDQFVIWGVWRGQNKFGTATVAH